MRSLVSGPLRVAIHGALAVSVLFLASCGNPVSQTPVPSAIDGGGAQDAGPGSAGDADTDPVDSESGGGDASTSGGVGGDAATVMGNGSPTVDAFVDVGPARDIDAGVGSLPPEPQFPPACATLLANKTKSGGTLADESNPDTARIQAAIDGCSAGQSVQLAVGAGGDAFLTGPLTMKAGVTLWVDTNATLFASRNPRDFDVAPGTCGTFANNSSSGCKPLIAVTVANAGIVGGGIIDGRGGEPMVGATTTWWDVAQGAKTAE
ncbi:MAG: hypothetical protein M3O46_13600 [Myxococcota bacterium]|nr:hypothetical protein [Myxococcota bacterium]